MKTYLVLTTLILFAWPLLSQHHCTDFDPLTGTPIQAQTSTAPKILYYTAVPTVVDIKEPFHLELTIDQNVDSIRVQQGLLSRDFVFYDNGKYPDLVANDKIYSSQEIYPSQIAFTSNILTTTNGKFDRFKNITFYSNGEEETINFDLGGGIRFINEENVDIPKVKVLNDSIQITEYVINIAYNYTYGEPFLPRSIFSSFDKMAEIFGGIVIDDNHILFNNYTNPTPGAPAGSHSTVNNSTLGTGVNYSPSPYRFESFLSMYFTYNGASPLLVHEVLHRHCSHLTRLGLSRGDGHWGIIQRPSNGFGSGNIYVAKEITETGKDTFTMTPSEDFFYSDIERYLLGLIPVDSVEFPIRYIDSSTRITREIHTGKLKEITKEEFLAEMGPRTPEFEESNRKLTTIVWSKKLLSPKELAFFDYGARSLESETPVETVKGNLVPNIYTASDGLMQITSKLRFVDEDNDGYDLFDDCNDKDPDINPGMMEIPNNGIDENCDGNDLLSSTFALADIEVSIFPNPVSSKLNIVTHSHREILVNLYDLNGKRLHCPFDGSSILVSHLDGGTYILEVIEKNSNDKIVEKIFIQR